MKIIICPVAHPCTPLPTPQARVVDWRRKEKNLSTKEKVMLFFARGGGVVFILLSLINYTK